jgi:hypothetical protein
VEKTTTTPDQLAALFDGEHASHSKVFGIDISPARFVFNFLDSELKPSSPIYYL